MSGTPLVVWFCQATRTLAPDAVTRGLLGTLRSDNSFLAAKLAPLFVLLRKQTFLSIPSSSIQATNTLLPWTKICSSLEVTPALLLRLTRAPNAPPLLVLREK
jgi:hypothetical protein